MSDFEARQIRFMDLECDRRDPHVNTVGRLPGSTRFMAPEKFQLEAVIDHRTTVFNLGRLMAIFTDRHLLPPELEHLIGSATRPNPADRPDSPVAFRARWLGAVGESAGR